VCPTVLWNWKINFHLKYIFDGILLIFIIFFHHNILQGYNLYIFKYLNNIIVLTSRLIIKKNKIKIIILIRFIFV